MSCGFGVPAAAVLLVLWRASAAPAQDIRRGTLIEDVTCAADASESYALYVPSTYAADRPSNLLIAFHPAARGRLMVEKYEAAAEQYGYIVAASNTSRNGPWSVSASAVRAMSADLGRRFAIDADRIYLAGLSGGARVAMQVALGKNNIAGVIASSAGFPDSRPRSTVPFPVFGTAGTEDFNYIEMRVLDRKLTSPHHVAIFSGGHTLPPDEVALEAIEWMELQAMRTGRRTPDDALVGRLFEKRQRLIAASASAAATVHLLDALVADFNGLRDVSAEAARAKALSRRPEVKKSLARERADEDAEARLLEDIFALEAGLNDERRHAAALIQLRDRLSGLARAAADGADQSPARSQARRVLRAIASGAAARVPDAEYQKLLDQYGMRGR